MNEKYMLEDDTANAQPLNLKLDDYALFDIGGIFLQQTDHHHGSQGWNT